VFTAALTGITEANYKTDYSVRTYAIVELTDGSKGEVNVKALKFGLTEMINEGLDVENEALEVKRPLLTAKQVGRLITKMGTENAVNQLNNAIVESTKSEEKN
jgi:hypothetical protein